MSNIHTKETFIPLPDGKLFCQTFGEGQPLVVLHGGPGLGCHYLLPQMGALGEFSQAIFYDQRGAGNSNSTDAWQAKPFETYCDDINSIRKHFGLEKISLLSHSYGSIFLSFYALAFPQYVDKIIYVTPIPVSSENYLAFVKHRSQIVDTNKAALDALRNTAAFKQGDPKTIEEFYRIYFKNYFSKPDLANTLSLTMTPTAAINNFKIYEFFYHYVSKHSFDLYEKLKTLNKPCLIVGADKDIIPLEYTEQLHTSFPKATYNILKNCGHFPYIDQPEMLFERIKNFLEITEQA